MEDRVTDPTTTAEDGTILARTEVPEATILLKHEGPGMLARIVSVTSKIVLEGEAKMHYTVVTGAAGNFIEMYVDPADERAVREKLADEGFEIVED